MKKAPLALGVIAAGVLALTTACGGSTGTTGSGDKVTLDWIMWAASDAETGAWQHVADLVHEKHPNLTVKLSTAAWPDYWSKLPTVLAGSNVPCIVGLQMGYVPAFASSFPGLNARLDKAGIKKADFDPGIWATMSHDGQILAVPYDYGPYIIFYNKDAFKAAGLTDPANGWKVEEFLADAHKLTNAAKSKYGFAVNNGIDALEQWAPAISKVQPVTDALKLNVNTPEITKALEWYAGLVTKEKVAAPLAATATADAGASFLGGNAAMYVDGPWALINAKAQAKFNVGVVTIPDFGNGVLTTTGGSGFGLSAKCDHPDEAMQAIAVITGDDSLKYLAGAGRAWPARPADQADFYPAAPEGTQATLELAASNVLPYRPTPTWAQDGSNYANGSIPVINGEKSAAEFLAALQEQSPSK
jgi:multiple sugar transport system substrate-binding protein